MSPPHAYGRLAYRPIVARSCGPVPGFRGIWSRASLSPFFHDPKLSGVPSHSISLPDRRTRNLDQHSEGAHRVAFHDASRFHRVRGREVDYRPRSAIGVDRNQATRLGIERPCEQSTSPDSGEHRAQQLDAHRGLARLSGRAVEGRVQPPANIAKVIERMRQPVKQPGLRQGRQRQSRVSDFRVSMTHRLSRRYLSRIAGARSRRALLAGDSGSRRRECACVCPRRIDASARGASGNPRPSTHAGGPTDAKSRVRPIRPAPRSDSELRR